MPREIINKRAPFSITLPKNAKTAAKSHILCVRVVFVVLPRTLPEQQVFSNLHFKTRKTVVGKKPNLDTEYFPFNRTLGQDNAHLAELRQLPGPTGFTASDSKAL